MASNKLSRYLWGTGTGLLAKSVGYVGGFLSVYLLIRILGSTGYGGYVSCIALIELTRIVLKVGLDKQITYRVPQILENNGRSEATAFFTKSIVCASLLAVAGLSLLYGVLFLPFLNENQFKEMVWWLWLLGLLLPVLTLKDLTSDWLTVSDRIPEMHYLETILPKIIFVSGLSYLYFFDYSKDMYVATILIASHLVPLGAWLFKDLRGSYFNIWKGKSFDWTFNFRMTLNDFVKESLWRVDVLFVYFFLGPAVAGGYKVCAKIAKVTRLADNLTTKVFKPTIGKYLANRKMNELRSEYNMLRTLTLSYSLFYSTSLILVGDFILNIFEDFGSFHSVLLILAFGYSVVIGFGNIGNLLVMDGASGWVLGASLVGAIFNLIGNLILIPLLGAVGAALATSISIFAQNLFAYFGVRRVLEVDILELGELIIPIVGLCWVFSFSELLFDLSFLWLLAVFLPIVHVIFNRKRLKKIARRVLF